MAYNDDDEDALHPLSPVTPLKQPAGAKGRRNGANSLENVLKIQRNANSRKFGQMMEPKGEIADARLTLENDEHVAEQEEEETEDVLKE